MNGSLEELRCLVMVLFMRVNGINRQILGKEEEFKYGQMVHDMMDFG